MTNNDAPMKDFPKFLPEIEDDLRSYLICPDRLPMHQIENVQELWPRSPNVSRLMNFDITPLSTTLKVQRDYDTGEIIGFKEVPVQNAGENSLNSMSYTRAPADQSSNSVRGNPLHLPFCPGSFAKNVVAPKVADFDDGNLLRSAPGISKGLLFDSDGQTVIGYSTKDDIPIKLNIPAENKINLAQLIRDEEAKLGIWKGDDPDNIDDSSHQDDETDIEANAPTEEESILPVEEPFIVLSTSSSRQDRLNGSEFAVVLDCSQPVENFNQLIPNMAHHYPFELDTFQKQAIIQLEQHNHVFVAAHTSAGKTVVAEYAIALCEKHMTRSIYTSPIKALSNQKYRDFKQTFKDVGLITGDWQINPTASCLIMTTEILRSMLYCGSEVTRDIEYVIFDEVHYINDKERGHVWEQVLIMLPARVCVVLLSATVPNTIEFADWLGRTHQRKVYVVSTMHRPVPLEHFLYTGSGGSSKHNRFKILDSAGWHREGYDQSKLTITNSNNVMRHSEKQEKTMWYALMDHLNTKDLLPVVVFTFSRQKCDRNAENLSSLDLTSQKEKSAITGFFEDCIRNLKEPDRNIPQIIRMRDILRRGIGVHHSGILPIIKEMVELLFQKRLVKLLFATETFAMGVNMPSRTVIFDSITKHDGRERRQLLPAEYIQMAGRAGRRGKDKKGTVIILCKGEIPHSMNLQEMMLGRPSQLTSQFRITYGMVLSLLRVESLSVEGMMSRSFREADHQKSMIKLQEKLVKVEDELKNNYSQELSGYLQPLVSFYQKSRRFIDFRKVHMGTILSSAKALKELQSGRVCLVTIANHINKLGMILAQSKKLPITFRVLILSDDEDGKDAKDVKGVKSDVYDPKSFVKDVKSDDKDTKNEDTSDYWHKMLGLARDSIYCPTTNTNHEVITVSPTDIFQICDKKIKTDPELVLKDWDKRQIPRFKADPPGPTCKSAVEELFKYSSSMKNQSKLNVKFLDLIKDIHISEQTMYENIETMGGLRDQVDEQMARLQIPNFEQQYRVVFKKKSLEDERDYLKHMLSDASMALYPDYENRIQLLRHLKYVDASNRVELKGRVACEMGMNELLITELVLRNVLTKLKPAEVAALLSSMVFQAKTNVDMSESELTVDLANGVKEIKQIFAEIQNLETEYEVYGDDFKGLNFGLVHVVYEWASEKPFADIMLLTDIQEGIIVRCIQQLNEIICDVKNAARLIGEPALQNKMEEASTAIKRDIVFAASLYTQRDTSTLKP